MSRCDVAATWPAERGLLPNLERLDVSRNALVGDAPDPTGWPRLTHYRAARNRFSGPALEALFAALPPSLVALDLSGNAGLPRAAPLPAPRALPNLRVLRLNAMGLAGKARGAAHLGEAERSP